LAGFDQSGVKTKGLEKLRPDETATLTANRQRFLVGVGDNHFAGEANAFSQRQSLANFGRTCLTGAKLSQANLRVTDDGDRYDVVTCGPFYRGLGETKRLEQRRVRFLVGFRHCANLREHATFVDTLTVLSCHFVCWPVGVGRGNLPVL